MQIKPYRAVKGTHFDNDQAKGVDARVVIGKQDGGKHFCMRVFEIGPGGYTPMHSHDWEHEMFVHAGEGEVFGNGGWTPLKPGNAVFIPADEVHQMRNSGQELLVVVCLIPGSAPEL